MDTRKSDDDAQPTIGIDRLTLDVTMAKTYLIWREDSSRDDAKRVKADYTELAVTKWAEWVDASGADYTIVGGQEERVFVALDEDGSEPEMFEVHGESMPVYRAKSVSSKPL